MTLEINQLGIKTENNRILLGIAKEIVDLQIEIDKSKQKMERLLKGIN